MPPRGWRSISIPEPLYRQLKGEARRLGKSVSELAREILVQELEAFRGKLPLKREKSEEGGVIVAGV